MAATSRCERSHRSPAAIRGRVKVKLAENFRNECSQRELAARTWEAVGPGAFHLGKRRVDLVGAGRPLTGRHSHRCPAAIDGNGSAKEVPTKRRREREGCPSSGDVPVPSARPSPRARWGRLVSSTRLGWAKRVNPQGTPSLVRFRAFRSLNASIITGPDSMGPAAPRESPSAQPRRVSPGSVLTGRGTRHPRPALFPTPGAPPVAAAWPPPGPPAETPGGRWRRHRCGPFRAGWASPYPRRPLLPFHSLTLRSPLGRR